MTGCDVETLSNMETTLDLNILQVLQLPPDSVSLSRHIQSSKFGEVRHSEERRKESEHRNANTDSLYAL